MKTVNFTEMKSGTKDEYLLLDKYEKEYIDGIRKGDIGQILQILEEKGKNHDIQKLKEMQTLRQQRNKHVLDKLANSACCGSVIDSSQIASAMILLKAMKKYKAKIVAKRKA